MDAFITIERKRKLIISDLKTRVNSSLPKPHHSRTSEMQLSVYHQLFSRMIDGDMDINQFYSALSLDSEEVFSDGFLVEAGTSYANAGILTFDMLLENNNLNVSLNSTFAYYRNFGVL